jgi:hypothetical protein
MFRRGVVFLILTSMMLHYASRMNFLSYLYEQRHSIAYQIRLIAEIPIAICSSDYDFSKSLKLDTHDDEKSSLPFTFSQGREITLFVQSSLFSLDPRPEGLIESHLTAIPQKKYIPPGFPVFHPPA